jgi:uncharacterized protein YecT (DUF1311 family)
MLLFAPVAGAMQPASDADLMRFDLAAEDARLNHQYQSASALLDSAQRADLLVAQREWLAWRDRECQSGGLPRESKAWLAAVSANQPMWDCVVAATAGRATELQRESAGVQDQAYPSRFNPYSRFRKRTPVLRTSGKWYFEVTLDLDWIARNFPGTDVMAGFVSDLSPVVTVITVTPGMVNAPKAHYGLAIDLDNGHVYVSRNRAWQGGEPGSGQGQLATIGNRYGARTGPLAHGADILIAGAFVANFGDEPFWDVLPAGYRAWRDQTCDAPQNSRETALCLDQDLRAADLLINRSYERLLSASTATEQGQLRQEQRAWLAGRNRSCELPKSMAADRATWYRQLLLNTPMALCVTRITRQRDAELQKRLLPESERSNNAVSRNSTSPVDSFLDYQTLAGAKHSSGKWYFEVTVQRSGIATLAPAEFSLGCGEFVGNTAATYSMKITRMDEREAPVTVGMLVDLDAGRLYASENGRWAHGEPGSQNGLLMKPGREYGCGVHASVNLRDLEKRGLIAANFGGGRRFEYAVPAGAQPFMAP